MPTMRDMALPNFPERFIDVVDHGPEVGPGRQGVLEGGQHAGPRIGAGAIPRFAERSAKPRLLVPVPCRQPVALAGEHLARGRVEASRLLRCPSFLQGFLDLEHLEVTHALHSPPSEMATGPSSGPFRGGRGPGYAENDVPHPQLDFALGLTNVKPPVSPCWT